MENPKSQTTEEIVEALLTNEKRQYTESAHAEIYRRLINTIKVFNTKAENTTKFMVILAIAQVLLAFTQIVLAVKR